MPMQISVCKQTTLVMLVFNGVFRRKNRGEKQWVRISIHSVHIACVAISAPIASHDAVWIQARHNLENKLLEQQSSLLTITLEEIVHAL